MKTAKKKELKLTAKDEDWLRKQPKSRQSRLREKLLKKIKKASISDRVARRFLERSV
jgi:hypothetical protein